MTPKRQRQMIYKMGTLYAFINQAHYESWAKDTAVYEPSIERFLREVGTTRIKYSKEQLVTPFVPVKSGGCVRIIQKYPTLVKSAPLFEANTRPQSKNENKPHGFFCRMKKFFGMKP
jgi:hypothetical protein